MKNVLIFLAIIAAGTSTSVQEKQILDRLFDQRSYDIHIRPSNDSKPTLVHVNLYVRLIEKLDEVNMNFKTQITFRMQWNDHRLVADLPKELPYLTITDASKLWIPDLFFTNEMSSYSHDLLKPNQYARLYPNGDVLFSKRLTMTLSCPMNLRYFPMDTQTCSIRMASYGYTKDDIEFLWKKADPIQVASNLHLPKMTLSKFQTKYCDSFTNTGVYSCLQTDFEFNREFSYYLVQVYIPTAMLVIISWISFWIHPKHSTARIIVPLIALVSIASGCQLLNTKIPETSYTKSIDVWAGTSCIFIFASLLVAATALFCHAHDQPEANNDNSTEDQHGLLKIKYRTLNLRRKPIAHIVDVVARFLFPIAFIIFVAIYASI